jgi:glycosyltransferase involved in cell wall biosynthesis
VDAVTNQAFAWRRRFDAWGWGGHDYAPPAAPGIPPGRLRKLREYRRHPGELTLLHYSGFARGLEELVDGRTLLLSHNITPARYFWAHDPVAAAYCELGRDQLAGLARAAGGLAGVSEFNAAELRQLSGRSAEAIPVLFDPAALPPGPDAAPDGPPLILFVGRLAPHKRQDLVIRAFARFRDRHPEARLTLIGTPLTPEFEAGLRSLAPAGTSFHTDGISAAELASAYRSAHAFLCLSEHEGFCIPLLEAFSHGVPVIARDAGAVGEVVGDAGVLLGPEDGVATVAEVLSIVCVDRELRAELEARGRRRVAAYAPSRVEAQMRTVLERLG